MLARLIARSRDRSGPTVRQDDTVSITEEWELARARATSDAELAEIDAVFGRHAA